MWSGDVSSLYYLLLQLCGLYCWHANHPLSLDDLVMPVESGQSCCEGMHYITIVIVLICPAGFKAACEQYKK